MWKIRKQENHQRVILNISGRIEAAELVELQRALCAEQSSQPIELDLQDVKLVDQEAVIFFACCEAGGTRLLNCPPYIREWISREQARPASNANDPS